MEKNTRTFTKEAINCIKYSNILANTLGKKTISGDELFFGVYNYISEITWSEILFSLLGIKDSDVLEEYMNWKYWSHGTKSNKDLTFNKKLENEFLKNKKNSKFDFMLLFYISFFDLSTDFRNYLFDYKIDTKALKENCKNISSNPIVNKSGMFDFLEILDKIFNKLNLDPKNTHIMKIEQFDNIEDLNTMLNSLEWGVMEENDEQTSTTTKPAKKDDKKMTIDYFGTDLTKECKDGFIDPIIGRDQEIKQVIYTLLRKNKNNPLLLWEAGVGKTAIVEWLAQKIIMGDVPEKLLNKKIYLLDMWTLLAGTKYRGEFEARMKSILEEAVDENNNIILFIDELHTIIGAGWQDNNDAAQMIKPLLSRGKIKLIGATTFDEYQKHIEKDAALKRRFQEINVGEPDEESTKQILMWLKETYENFHGVKITQETIESSIKLSKRYMLNKHLPDKALDILDEACARKSTMQVKLEKDNSYKKLEKDIENIEKKIEKSIEWQDYFKAAELKEKEEKMKKEMKTIRSNKNMPQHLRPEINTHDIGVVLSEKTGIPVSVVNQSEIDRLKQLDRDLRKHILGQEEAVEAIVKTITRNRLSMIEKNKPIGSFLFLGPSGVGKTYLAKLIAKNYFGDEDSIVRIDMSEFMEKHSISKLIGSPAGYVWYDEGWQLTEAVRRKPYTVLLFDEIEKASTDVLNILLQILDEGKLKDSKWRWIDFKSTIIVMTSNLGSEEFSKKRATIGFNANATDGKEIDENQFTTIRSRILDELKDFMSPELINRIDYKIVFKPLTKEIVRGIFEKNLKEFLDVWTLNKDVTIPSFTKTKIKEIVDEIYDPQYGARPIQRYIHDKIENEIIEQIMK